MRVENLKKQESVVESVLFTMGQSVEIRQLAAACLLYTSWSVISVIGIS